MKRITPVKSIRGYCLGCCVDQWREVERCPSKKCSLWKFRFGKGKGKKLKAVRERCLNCSAFSPVKVKDCEFDDCPLFPYRFGKNPKRKGIGGRGRPFPEKIAT